MDLNDLAARDWRRHERLRRHPRPAARARRGRRHRRRRDRHEHRVPPRRGGGARRRRASSATRSAAGLRPSRSAASGPRSPTPATSCSGSAALRRSSGSPNASPPTSACARSATCSFAALRPRSPRSRPAPRCSGAWAPGRMVSPAEAYELNPLLERRPAGRLLLPPGRLCRARSGRRRLPRCALALGVGSSRGPRSRHRSHWGPINSVATARGAIRTAGRLRRRRLVGPDRRDGGRSAAGRAGPSADRCHAW